MKAILTLTILGILTACLLAVSFSMTRDQISANRETHANERLKDLVPSTDEATLCKLQTTIHNATVQGYGGKMRVAAVFREGELIGIRALEHSETPGFSDILEPGQWISRFGRQSVDDVDAVTRATITSNAVLRAARQILANADQGVTNC